jgi:hypothetical protein
MATNRKFLIVKSQPQTESVLSPLASIGICALIVAFGVLWFEFFRNLAALPKTMMFWDFNF